ncbi:MAG TPA: hypothetical protein PLX02_05260 [Syntrophorhabdaceae bacterium]|nr:hypothetical protein [Syntrophorhabdaceae bacterium]HQM81013.1 hypothetical protein [Syntrophorhabdaceae bacterium]
MTEVDTWGRDPQVRYMREVFGGIESAQNEMLLKVSIDPHDERLRRLREVALKLFEGTWVTAIQRGVAKSREDAGAVYLFCLARALSMRGIDVPGEALPKNGAIEKFMKEVLK